MHEVSFCFSLRDLLLDVFYLWARVEFSMTMTRAESVGCSLTFRASVVKAGFTWMYECSFVLALLLTRQNLSPVLRSISSFIVAAVSGLVSSVLPQLVPCRVPNQYHPGLASSSVPQTPWDRYTFQSLNPNLDLSRRLDFPNS